MLRERGQQNQIRALENVVVSVNAIITTYVIRAFSQHLHKGILCFGEAHSAQNAFRDDTNNSVYSLFIIFLQT